MNNYNKLEKKISNFLKRNAIFHSKAKFFYQQFSYFLNKKKGFKAELCNGCNIIDLKVNNGFFGYYDHTPWSQDMKHFILHIQEKESLQLNLYTFSNNKISLKKNLIRSKFYNLQQGIRAIWINNNEIIFNQIIEKKLISSIYNIKNDSTKNIDVPIQEISRKNNLIISIDYMNLDSVNKDYGYNLDNDISQNKISGIVGCNYLNNNILFEIEKEQIHNISKNHNFPINECEINHIVHSPYSNSFAFIYRNKKFNAYSELYKYNYETNDLIRLYSGKLMSHYCWINQNIIFAYLEHKDKLGFFEIDYRNSIKLTQKILPIYKDNLVDGHPSISPNKKWIVYDTYPDKARQSYLYIVRNNLDIKPKKILLGKFHSPLKFNGYYRCDLHPRWSPDGSFISIDSTHEGIRKNYLINISSILNEYE